MCHNIIWWLLILRSHSGTGIALTIDGCYLLKEVTLKLHNAITGNSISLKIWILRISTGLILLFWGALFISCENYCDDCRVVAVDDTPPDAPQGVYSVTGDHAVYLYWLDSPEKDLSHYWVWRGEEAIDGPYERMQKVYENHYTDRSVVNGRTYYYAVTAVDIHGNESSELSREDVFDTPRPAGSGVVLHDFHVHPEVSGFDFRNAQVRNKDNSLTDIYFEYDPNYDAFFVWATYFDESQTDIQDYGYTENLDELDWAPSDGWSRVGWLEAIPGHSYYVWTADDHYAKFRIDEMNYSGRTVTISWAYQTVQSYPELMPVRPKREPVERVMTKFIADDNMR